jgi:L-aspartate oxidase
MSKPPYDYIIIGSGIAGLMTAYHASTKTKKRKSILVISKGKISESSSYMAQGGIAAAVSQKDSFASHAADTLNAGHNLNNKTTVEFIVKEAPKAIKLLSKLGVKFCKTPTGNFQLKLEGGHSHSRIIHSKDQIGKALITTLYAKLKNNPKIVFKNNSTVIDLMVKNQNCHGIAFYNNKKPDSCIKYLYGKKTVLCTGGIGQLFKKTTNPLSAFGDGLTLAYNAGCKMEGLNYIQFHPTALNISKKEPANQKPLFLLSETLRGEGAHLLNNKFVRFMVKAHPQAELAPRDIISQNIFNQLKKGNVFLDLRHIEKKILKEKYPAIYHRLKKEGIDTTKNLIPVIPAAHYLCGGIKTNLSGQTNVKNLYAIGECASTGLHGSNRLASNSLLEAVVMAKEITHSPHYHLKNPPLFIANHSSTNILKESPSDKNAIKEIQNIMWIYCTFKPNKKNLSKAAKEIEQINKSSPTKSLRLQSVLTAANLIIQSMLSHTATIGRKA